MKLPHSILNPLEVNAYLVCDLNRSLLSEFFCRPSQRFFVLLTMIASVFSVTSGDDIQNRKSAAVMIWNKMIVRYRTLLTSTIGAPIIPIFNTVVPFLKRKVRYERGIAFDSIARVSPLFVYVKFTGFQLVVSIRPSQLNFIGIFSFVRFIVLTMLFNVIFVVLAMIFLEKWVSPSRAFALLSLNFRLLTTDSLCFRSTLFTARSESDFLYRRKTIGRLFLLALTANFCGFIHGTFLSPHSMMSSAGGGIIRFSEAILADALIVPQNLEVQYGQIV